MKCSRCSGKGKIRIPKDEKAFDACVDADSEKAPLTIGDAIEKAYEHVGFYWGECPDCHGTGKVDK